MQLQSVDVANSIMKINTFMPSGLFYLKSLDKFISYIGGVWLNFIITTFCKNF